MDLPARLPLARLPTPLERLDRLQAAWGGPEIWVKRDDLTGFELSGNKIRKLEFHLAAARDAGAGTVITCGAAQSNHCRATAHAAARLGLHSVLLLRTPDGRPPAAATGNLLLCRLAGAEVRFVTPDEYDRRDELLAAEAGDRSDAWVIPEGASDWLGMLGFVLAMRELADQLVHVGREPAAVWHAASSAGTTAGLGWGAHRLGIPAPIVGTSVGDTAADIAARVDEIWSAARDRLGGPVPEPRWEVLDDHVGLGYGRTTAAELAVQAEATALTGLVFDPTYTGKAIYALRREIDAGRFTPDDAVIFWHTGGGFAALAHDWSPIFGEPTPAGSA